MSGIARATLVGNITRQPELNQSGKVLSIGLAVNRREKDQTGEWGDAVSFFDIKVLGNRAQALAKLLSKGMLVAVDAKVVQERWETDTGDKRSVVRFLADEVVFLSAPKEAGFEQGEIPGDLPAPKPVEAAGFVDDDSIPF